ncbi:MAG: protein kinase [Gemmatimonadaceae bacterium]|nr:protein kinase [Gemmatimonadaceae bacterium]
MSASFQEHLELALGDEYRVVRELGGGGMSRVFLAVEVALGRNVVIKVLTPELAAGVNRERFRREVQLAAGLQHPMIVPLLTAGEAEGLLWYTMPFVEGESLRERIQRGPMSGREALPILVDIARALGAAHRKNIVHRDIKPGNILLHEQHAVVADFGVAKALTAAVAGSTGLTTSGLAVGTPAYMSPEQAAGDATVDARADIYALGCVAYEMLSGKPPFVDPSAARTLVAQVSQAPVPLPQVAPVKAGMAAVIMRCLEKDPALRWPTADALAEAFELQRFTGEPTPVPPVATTSPSRSATPAPAPAGRPTPPPAASATGRARMIGGGAAVAIAVAVGVALSGSRDGQKTATAFVAPQTVIVADVENQTPDSTLGNLLSESLRAELQESKIATVMTPAATASALERMQRPVSSRIPRALATEIAVREGVSLVVAGRIQKVGNTYLVRAALVSPGDGGEASAIQETAASEDDLIAAIGRLARRTREKLGESATTLTALQPMERVTTTSLDALRKYTEALRLDDAPTREGEARDRDITLLEEAVQLDPTFAMAWRRLGVRLTRFGGGPFSNERYLRGVAALTKAFELRSKLSPVERGLAEAAYFSTVQHDEARADAAYAAILTEQPGNRIALNNLASAALNSGAYERVREYGQRYLAIDSTNIDAWPWVIWGAYGTNRTGEAQATRRAMHDRFTSPAEVIRLADLELQWLRVERDWPGLETLARRELAGTTDTHRADHLLRSLMAALTMRGRLEAAWRMNDSIGAVRLAGRDTMQQRLWRGDAAHQRAFDKAWYADDTVGMGAAIRTYIAAAGIDRWRMQDRPLFNLVVDYMVAGDAKGARERFQAYRAAAAREKGLGDLPPVTSPIFRAVEAQVLLTERRPREALALLLPAAGEASRFPQPQTFYIARAYLDAGQRDSARTWFARLTDTPDPRRAWSETEFRPRALQALCFLAESAEQKTRWCGALAGEWKDADAMLQPIVARARARLTE